ncbi:MAG: glucosylglycerol hydrolase [Trueperaceae bacterium]|nr:glucosylglycerol hydrolase [Trueperaceae bacterium]
MSGAASAGRVHADEVATRALAERAAGSLREHDAHQAARALARMAGARPVDGVAEFGVWLPQCTGRGDKVEVEILQPHEEVRLGETQRIPVARHRFEMTQTGGWAWLAVRGLRPGERDVLGALYRFVATHEDGREARWGDPLATSLPFGLEGPAELYDLDRLQVHRADAEFFRRVGIGGDGSEDGIPRFGPPGHVLQVHVGTATHGGTIADLADLYRALADKARRGETPTPAERVFLGYDAVQLLPVEPVPAHSGDPPRFAVREDEDGLVVQLGGSEVRNWGYDATVFGAAAIEPSLLRSGRPDELADLAGVLHAFPGKPIRLIVDLVLSHAHAVAAGLLPPAFFAGEGPYGLELALHDPTVRAVLLELQRRKVDFGADGVRIDAAQDFRVPGSDGGAVHDDGFLQEMSDVVQCVADVHYHAFMIFEDGRPWPRRDWPTAATYLDVAEVQPHAFQWGPLTFAHNTPCVEGFWASSWWRIEESARHGQRWISGCANHDTLRRAYQTPPWLPLNRRLGRDPPEILRRAYDHVAADLLFYGVLPGVPMTFLAAAMGAPWAFFRSSDHALAPRLAADEADVLSWRFRDEDYASEGAFARLKGLGFARRTDAETFFLGLRPLLADGGLAPDALAEAAGAAEVPMPFSPSGAALVRASRAFMLDLADACVVWRAEDDLVPERVDALRALRAVRAARPWLRRPLRDGESVARRVGLDGGLRVHGLRHAPDGGESLGLIANLEGDPVELVPEAVLGAAPWQVLVAAPGVGFEAPDRPMVLRNAEGVLLHHGG